MPICGAPGVEGYAYACPCPECIEADLADPGGDGRLTGLRPGVTGSPPPLPDEAVVLVSEFSDHVGLDTKEFEWWCFEE